MMAVLEKLVHGPPLTLDELTIPAWRNLAFYHAEIVYIAAQPESD